MPKSLQIWLNGKVVGSMVGRTAYKTIGSNHLLIIPELSICYDVELLEMFKKYGIEKLSVRNKDTGMRYTTTLEYFSKNSFPVQRGAGNQRGLAIRKWTVNDG